MYSLRCDAGPTGGKLDNSQALTYGEMREGYRCIGSHCFTSGHLPRPSVCPHALLDREMCLGRKGWGSATAARLTCALHRYRRKYQTRVSLIDVSIGP